MSTYPATYRWERILFTY